MLYLCGDVDQANRDIVGFEDLTDMAIKLKDDYKEMIDSVKKNKGFYVGRYEIGKDENNAPQEKAGNVMNYVNWYHAYSACKSFSKGNVQSRMIWGCQWDQVCRFISSLGDKKVESLSDSRSYGNFSNSTGDAETNRGSLGEPASTGLRNQAWKTNNIYDFAGNCLEWTQEASRSYSCSQRAEDVITGVEAGTVHSFQFLDDIFGMVQLEGTIIILLDQYYI